MADPLGETAAAVYATLDAAGAALPDVFQHVPQDHAPPVVIIGDIELGELATKDDDGGDAPVKGQVLVIFQGEENKSVTDWNAEVRTRLHNVTLTSGGYRVALTVDRQTVQLIDDGITYVGTTYFSGWALNA
jgi:hypothetical protein